MIKLKVLLMAPPTPEAEAAADAPAVQPAGTRKATTRSWEIAARAADLGLQYNPLANPLNPRVAWPLLEQGTFANLQPSFFRLPERERLFKSRFGFDNWDDAEAFFNISFRELSLKKNHKSLLHPFFQYMAALWRMKTGVGLEELAAYFGVTRWKIVSPPPCMISVFI